MKHPAAPQDYWPRVVFDSSDPEVTGSVTTRVSSDPFPEQKEAFIRGFGRAEDLFQTPREFFPGSTVTPFTSQQEQALQGLEQRALQGSPLVDAAQQNIQSILSPEFTSQQNPAFQALSDRLFGDINQRVSSEFTGAGRRGSSANQETLARAFGDTIAPIAFEDLARRQNLQFQASQFAPQLANVDFADLAQLANVGNIRQQQEDLGLQDLVRRFNFGQQEPRTRLQEFMNLIGGGTIPGQGTTTTTSPLTTVSPSPLQTGLGVATGLAGLASTAGLFR